MSDATDYKAFVDNVVRETASLSAGTATTAHFVKRIRAFLKLADATSGKGHLGAIRWFFPDCLLGDKHISYSDQFRTPTEAERLDFSCTLLAMIHDGFKQDYAQRRIYFYWREAEQSFKADRASENQQKSRSLEGILTTLYGSSENALAQMMWEKYAIDPARDQAPDFFAGVRPAYRRVIEDALAAVKEDLLQLTPANAQGDDDHPSEGIASDKKTRRGKTPMTSERRAECRKLYDEYQTFLYWWKTQDKKRTGVRQAFLKKTNEERSKHGGKKLTLQDCNNMIRSGTPAQAKKPKKARARKRG